MPLLDSGNSCSGPGTVYLRSPDVPSYLGNTDVGVRLLTVSAASGLLSVRYSTRWLPPSWTSHVLVSSLFTCQCAELHRVALFFT